jgi:hypothetical protein
MWCRRLAKRGHESPTALADAFGCCYMTKLGVCCGSRPVSQHAAIFRRSRHLSVGAIWLVDDFSHIHSGPGGPSALTLNSFG